jgi:hypothetical protein
MAYPITPKAAVKKYAWMGAIVLGALPIVNVSAWNGLAGLALAEESPEATPAATMPKIAESAPSSVSAPGARVSTATVAQSPATAGAAEVAAAPVGTEFPLEFIEKLKRGLNPPTRSASEAGTLYADPAQPGANHAATPAAPAPVNNFTGIAFTGAIPPDPHIATGPSDLIVAVNRTWRIYNKTGAQLFNTTLGTWFANVLPKNQSGINVFDPWVIYDALSNRFVIFALARRASDQLSLFLIAVSDNSTAVGNWCNFSLDASVNGSARTNNWADFEKLGNTTNAVVLSANMFNFATPPAKDTFQYVKLRFISKAQLYNTSCPGISWWDFWDLRNADNTKAFTIEPANSYILSTTSYGINSEGSGGGNKLTLWRYTTPPAINPNVPTLIRQATLGVDRFSLAPNAVQKGSTTGIDSGDARLLNTIYRASGLWTAHTTGCTFVGDPTTRSCLRFYDINPGANSILQQGTFGNPGFYYYYPAITANAAGDATIVFNRSGPNEFAGIRYTGRRSTDLRNLLQGSASLQAGQGCYVHFDSDPDAGGRNRWGDYNGAAPDPSNERRAWIFSEYAFGTDTICGNNVWRTHVGQVTW